MESQIVVAIVWASGAVIVAMTALALDSWLFGKMNEGLGRIEVTLGAIQADFREFRRGSSDSSLRMNLDG